ncbi:MAG: hypothetical protein GY711_00890 [bacterium]|nr:hypothetical protein [bacterium]
MSNRLISLVRRHAPNLACFPVLLSNIALGQCNETVVVPSIGLNNDEAAIHRRLDVDGDTMVVGSALLTVEQELAVGLAFVFEYRDGTWNETQILRSGQVYQGQRFGGTVAIDGNTIMVGAMVGPPIIPGGGRVFVFERQNGSWVQTQQLFEPTIPFPSTLDGFGRNIKIRGDTAYITSGFRRKTVIYERMAGTWVLVDEITEDDLGAFPLPGNVSFGNGFLDVEGDRMVRSHLYTMMPAPVSVLEFDGTSWRGVASLTPQTPGQLETSPFIALEDGIVYVGSSSEQGGSGVVRVYEEQAGSWVETQVINPSILNPVMRFGAAIDVRGDTLVVGAPSDDIDPAQNDNNGAIYQFTRRNGQWVQDFRRTTAHPPPGNKGTLGATVFIHRNEIVAGSPADSDPGRVHVFPLIQQQGVPYGTANSNSSGLPAQLSATGSVVATHDCLTLEATHLPISQTGYFLTSRTQGYLPLVGNSQGDLLLAAPWYRFSQHVLETGPAGEVSFALSFETLPQGIQFQPGETWSFQMWFRDVNPGSTSNMSNGLAVTLVTPGDPAVQFPVTLRREIENAVQVPVEVTLSQPAEGNVIVPYTLGGTAAVGVDWDIDPPSPAVIPAGETSVTLTATIIEDSDVEGEEIATVTLGSPLGGVPGTTLEFQITILDDD